MLAASVALGTNLTGGPVGVAGMLLLLALWTLGYGGLFYLVGLRSRKPEALSALIPLFMPISMLSTAYVPRTLMPAWIAAAARANPYTYVVDGVRMFMTSPFTWAGFAAALAVAATVALGAHLLAARSFAALVHGD